MTIRNLAAVLEQLSRGASSLAIRADTTAQVRLTDSSTSQAQPFISQGTVTEVFPDGVTVLKDTGEQVRATQTTDEPLQAGVKVWWSDTVDGATIVHGSVR